MGMKSLPIKLSQVYWSKRTTSKRLRAVADRAKVSGPKNISLRSRPASNLTDLITEEGRASSRAETKKGMVSIQIKAQYRQLETLCPRT